MRQDDLDRVVPLNRLDDYEVADGDPDVRGWPVIAADGRGVGRVDQLLVDTNAMKVRYLDVDLTDDLDPAGAGRHALLPVGRAVLDRTARAVRVAGLTAAQCAALPEYGDGVPSGDYDRRLSEHWESAGAGHLTLSEEELAIHKRTRPAGAVGVEKRVETQHVRESVPLRREEVTVERRPITDPRGDGASIGEDEIRVPLHAEEAVVEKRVVPKEELVVRKREVVETETVEADLRRERAEVRGPGDVA